MYKITVMELNMASYSSCVIFWTCKSVLKIILKSKFKNHIVSLREDKCFLSFGGAHQVSKLEPCSWAGCMPSNINQFLQL